MDLSTMKRLSQYFWGRVPAVAACAMIGLTCSGCFALAVGAAGGAAGAVYVLDGEDVTQQSVDLDARLVNARASEARLKTILEQRTGRLSDVLDVEREISRVRGEIERMEAERKSLDGRIQFASINVTILEEQRASLDLGPQPLSTRFRNAFVEGWRDALGGAVEAGLVLTSLLPTLLMLALVALPAVAFYRRRLRAARTSLP